MTPTIGRIVLYRLSDADAAVITNLRTVMRTPANPVARGDIFPAMVVKTWGEADGSAVNLKVMLDGDDSHWATSRTEGDGEGHWCWPART